MWHNFKYDFLVCLRSKDVILWMLLFPVFLGTVFHIAFGNINSSNSFEAVPVAVVMEAENEAFRTVMDEITAGEEPLFAVTYTDSEQAMKLLEENEVSGIMFVDDSVKVSVSGLSSGTIINVKKTIVKSFAEQYNSTAAIIEDTMKTDITKLPSVVESLSEQVSCNEQLPLTDGNTDNVLGYFYNLIAMVGLLGSNLGVYMVADNQANLSPLGARRCCSPRRKFSSMVSSLLANFAAETICVSVSLTYLIFVLGIDFGTKIPFVYLAGILGGFLGTSFGFFVGSIGTKDGDTKSAICVAVSLTCCFFSGLMINVMKGMVDAVAPWFNEINPAAVISDAFYCLNIYDDYERFTTKIITMLIMTVVFCLGGFLLTRRRRYASL